MIHLCLSDFCRCSVLSRIWPFATPWTAARRASLSLTISQSLLRLISTESVMLSNHLIISHSLFLLPAIFTSIRVFSSESALWIRCSKYWSFSISPSNEYSGLISLRICCRYGDPFQGPKLGSCLTLRNELSEETHVLTKHEILLGKGTRAESRRVREPRRTALPHGLPSRVLWWWD